jgi:hypothetical protein
LEQSQAFHQIAPVKRAGEQHKDNPKTVKGGPVEQKWDRGIYYEPIRKMDLQG